MRALGRFANQIADSFQSLTQDEQQAVVALVNARARAANMTPDEYISTRIFGITRGGKPGSGEMLFHLPDELRIVKEIAKAYQEQGGRALLVGGMVRDYVLGMPSKDVDIEVYNLPPKQVRDIASRFGKVSDVGKSFGVLLLHTQDGLQIDISLPRRESKVSVGHKGFDIETDPYMDIETAARRRDFTMNAMLADPLTGEIIDPYGGLRDLRNRILRVVDAVTFAEDPLRVLRGMQFAARFRMTVEPWSREVMQNLALHLLELPRERIGEEWKKLLLKGIQPSFGLQLGKEIGVYEVLHPGLQAMIGCPQDPRYHAEGDVWEHTVMVVDCAARIVRRDRMGQQDKWIVMLAALCHDIGKPLVTVVSKSGITSRGHCRAGVEPARTFLWEIATDNFTRDCVLKLVEYHWHPQNLWYNRPENTVGAIRKLAKKIFPATILQLSALVEADIRGRICKARKLSARVAHWLRDQAAHVAVLDRPAEDIVKGRDWLALGFLPGKPIGELIRLANELRDIKGFSKEDILDRVRGISDVHEATRVLREALA